MPSNLHEKILQRLSPPHLHRDKSIVMISGLTQKSVCDNAGANRQAHFDGAGWFAFEEGRGDLSHRSCFEATLYFGKRWEILGEIFAFRQPAMLDVKPPPLASILP